MEDIFTFQGLRISKKGRFEGESVDFPCHPSPEPIFFKESPLRLHVSPLVSIHFVTKKWAPLYHMTRKTFLM